MKKLYSLLLLLVVLLGLCGCKKNIRQTSSTAAPSNNPSSSGPVHCHSFRDADCITPKTCTDCGETRGKALGHNYNEGFCLRCGAQDGSFVALTDGIWVLDALHTSGSHMERIYLRLFTDGSADLRADTYGLLSDIPEDQREEYIPDDEDWYDYSGEIYYFTGPRVDYKLTYNVDSSMINCILSNGDQLRGTLILERSAGNMLTVTYFEGDFSALFLQIGDVFSNE